MKTHQDLKSKTYIEPMLNFLEGLLSVDFKGSGRLRFSSYCPFHIETKDSFRVYVDGKDEVRFHCFGACNADWDLYDVIQLRRKCSFREAQVIWADHLGIKDFEPYRGRGKVPDPDEEPEPEETVEFTEPEELDPSIVDAMTEAVLFYNDLLLSERERFKAVWNYLAKRGVDEDAVFKFTIGYAPPFADEQCRGRALIQRLLPQFEADFTTFQRFYKSGLLRLLTEPNWNGRYTFSRYVDFSIRNPFTRAYADFFATRIVFPIFDVEGQIAGIVGRRPDNRSRANWIKQRVADNAVQPRTWLYGIDKAHRYIQHYRTIILVEGIFDYFAFYNLLQNEEKPFLVSTLGSRITREAVDIIKEMDVEHFVVAFDCDEAGQHGIDEAAREFDIQPYFLGGLAPGQDPHDKLNTMARFIDGFSMKHLLDGAKKAQKASSKPVGVHFMGSGPRDRRDVVFEADRAARAEMAEAAPRQASQKKAASKDCIYDAEDFLPLLSYDHGNRAMLDQTVEEIIQRLEARPEKSDAKQTFQVPGFFFDDESHREMGAAIILWLRIVIEQQRRKRKVRETDDTLAGWLHTSRVSVSNYKRRLRDLGFISIDTSTRPQNISVVFHPKQDSPVSPQR